MTSTAISSRRLRPGPIVQAGLERGLTVTAMARGAGVDYDSLARNRALPQDVIDRLQAVVEGAR